MKALVIPAHQPSGALLDLIDALEPGAFAPIVIVDEGSDAKYSGIFTQLSDRGVTLVRHAVPVGRGAAIRAGMHAALAQTQALDCIVLAEEFHSAAEIARVSQNEGVLTLGTDAGARRNRAMRLLAGIKVSNPWTTLRSIPARLVPHLLTLDPRGAEFDLQTLVVAAEHDVPISEIAAAPQPAHAGRALWPLVRFLAAARPYRAITRLIAAVTFAVFFGAIAAAIYGFAKGNLFHEFVWLAWGRRRLIHFGALFGAVSLPILLIFPWAYATVFAALLLGATALAEGPVAVFAVLFFLVSANASGRAVISRLGRVSHSPEPPDALATLLGIGIYATIMTLTARLPVNYAAAWALLLALPIALDLRGTASRLRAWFDALRAIELRNWRVRAALAILLGVLCVHWFVALQPESSADGLAMHLAVPMDIAANHVMTFHPNLFVWSVMPMAADFSYSIVYLLGGEAAASLLNFALLLMLVALLFRAAWQWLHPGPAMIVAALFASTPLVFLVTGSLFIENFVAVMIFGLVMALWRLQETGDARYLWLAAALGGTAASAKFGAWAFVLMAFAFAVVELRRRRAPGPALLAAALLLVFAAPPYIIAFAQTGNPVFPFLNSRFPSMMLERGVEFRNNNFAQPLTWKTPFDLTFHTGRFLEGLPGAFGFEYLFLIPLGAIALFAARSYAARIAAGVALAAGALVMVSQPYARYVYPAMPLLAIPLAALGARFAARQRRLCIALFAAAVGCIALNVYFSSVSGWYHKDFYSPTIFRKGGRARIIHDNIPLRDVTIRFREAYPQEPVLLLVEHDLADAGSNSFEYHWHQHRVWREISETQSVSAVRRVVSRLGIRYFISRRPGPDDDLLSPSSFGQFMASCTTTLFENGRFYAARVTPECESLSDTELETKLEMSPPALVSPGTYDDFDPALRFRGAWTRSKGFVGPYRRSVSYTFSPAAEVLFAFEGSELTYVFTKAFNRGIANLEIDGVPHEIDLFAPVPEWQSRLDFCCLGQGPHLAVLKATGRKSEESKDVYIDLDAFIAR